MEVLQAMAALSETISVDSDTSRILEAGVDRPGQRRGRKQAKPLRSAFSSDTPSNSQPMPVARQQQQAIVYDPTTGESPALNNQAGLEEAPAAVCSKVVVQVQVSSSSKGSKGPPAQRQGPCGHCKTPYSPQWRKGPRNKPVLCNACGIRYLRNRHLGRAVPQKKRSSGPTAKALAAGDSSAGEGSMDTLTDTTDMRATSKKRRTKKVDMGDEPTSSYSYGDSGLQGMGSVGSLQQLLLQHPHSCYSDTDQADADAAGGRRKDVSHALPDNGSGGRSGVGATAETAGVTFGTSAAMPGNMQPLLAPMHSGTSGSSIYGGGYGMALALQLYQQQQQQLLLNQQHLLLSQGSGSAGAAAGLQSAGSVPSSSLTAAPALQTQGSSAPGAPALASTSQLNPAQASLLYTQSLQMQQLQGYLLQQQQQQQAQAQVLQAASMLHGPSPLSVMSGAAAAGTVGSLALGGARTLSTMQAAPAAPSLEISPLVCTGDRAAASTAQPAANGPAAPAAAAAAAATSAGLAAPGNAAAAAGVFGTLQSLLAA